MMRYKVHPTDCNTFELDMISNAKIDGLLKTNTIETTCNGQFSINYEQSSLLRSLQDLINDNFYNVDRFHDLLTQIISMKFRLETYLLKSQNLHLNVDSVWYDPVSGKYNFIYLPYDKEDLLQELNLFRHIFIESPQILESNLKLLSELRINTYELDRFCSFFSKSITIKKKRGLLGIFMRQKEQSIITPDSKTIQKSRKSCLLDTLNPANLHEIHFNNNVIGRSDECNIQINDSSISRRHAIISKNKLQYTLDDLDSRNGTLHNGQVVQNTIPLVNGDKLQFGDKEFIFIL